ncbi:glycosyl transferase [Aureococcus anophagefferens]|nr:glycosyl transferase [Aureococcus anophagefferens]
MEVPGAASTPGSTPRLSAVCELAFPSRRPEPDAVVWTGEKYERYAGRRSTEALMQAILEAGQRVASPAAAAAEVAFDSTVSDLGASGADARDWKATLLRSLSLFGRIGPRMGPDAQKPIVEEITRGLETCFEAVASRSDPKRAELLVGLARTGHYELALRFEARLDERFGSAPPPPDGATPLFVAALGGSLARVEALLATPNVDVDSTTVDGRTPLFAAASNGRADVVRALLRAGASVERDAWTPLRVASQEGHVARAWELLEEAGVRDDPDVAPVDALPPRGAARRPKIIHLTDKSRAAVPPKVFAQFRRFAPDHEVRFYDDEACRAYLATHFPPAVVAKYLELDMPAHRADLFRYGVMFVEGGVYLDVKTVLVRPLDEAFPDEARLYTGATLSKWDKALYHSFTEQFYDVLRAQAAPLVVGSLSGTNVTLHAERCFDVGDGGCARGDRYGDCCTVRDAADRIHFVTRFQDYRLDESMDKMRLASELAEAGRRDEEKEALYSAVDAHQGNWRAMLLWGLALLEKPPAADRGQSPTFERAMWALQLCAAAVASPEPAAVAIARRAEMLELLAQSGHHDLARSFELFFDERMASAPPPAAAAAALEEARDAYVTLVTSDPLYGVGAEVLGLSIQAAEAERMEGLGGRGETRALVALVSNEPEMDGAARRLAAVGYDEVLRVETLSCAPLRGPAEVPERFETACTKLHVFNLTRFRTVLYLDADAVVTHETATSLFDRQLTSERPLAAAPDAPASSLFNTGVLVLKPSAELFAALLDGLDGGDSYDGADQGYLNGVFSE